MISIPKAVSAAPDLGATVRRAGLAMLLLVASAAAAMSSPAAPAAAPKGQVSAAAAAAVPTCRLADAEVEAFIAEVASGRQGHELCQYRLYDALGDVDGDGKDDFVVAFNVEGIDGGGNGVESYLAVFLSSRKPGVAIPRIKVGERGSRMPESVRTERREIVVGMLEYRDKDPMCCPSGKGEARFTLEHGALVPAPAAQTPSVPPSS